MPKVSVIIPVYNTEKYIERCLLSVTRQTHKNLEIICVNDATQDHAMEIVQKFAQSDPRIQIVIRGKNEGPSAARNSGFKVATGEYVYYIDSDDWIDENYLEILLQQALQHKTDIVLNNHIISEYEDGRQEDYYWGPYDKKIPQGEFLSREDAINNTPCMVWCHLYKRSFLVQHQLSFPEGYLNEDTYYHVITTLYADNVFAFYGPAAYHYLQRDYSIMGKLHKKGRPLAYVKIIKLMCDFFKEHPEFHRYPIKMVGATRFESIDSQEMFAISKSICEFVHTNLRSRQHLYSGMELFYIQAVLESKDFAELKSKYPKGLRVAFAAYCAGVCMHPKISVIVPVYNAEKYLDKTLSSMIHQTFRKIEIICVNDQSTDRSLEILQRFAKEDKRIKIINNAQNLGAARSRNAGMAQARGEFVSFIDSDDFLDFDFYEKLLGTALTTQADIVKGGYKYVPEHGTDGEVNKKIIEDKNNFSFGYCSAIFRRRLIQDNAIKFPELIDMEDPVFAYQAALKANTVQVVPECYVHITLHEDSQTAGIPSLPRIRDKWKGLAKMLDIANEAAISKESYLYTTVFWINMMFVSSVSNKETQSRTFVADQTFQLFDKIKYQDDFIKQLAIANDFLAQLFTERNKDKILHYEHAQKIYWIRKRLKNG